MVTHAMRKQTSEALKAINKLLITVQVYVMPKITAILSRYAFKQMEYQHRYVLHSIELSYSTNVYIVGYINSSRISCFSKISLSKGQLWSFFAFTIKEGISKIMHNNYNNNLNCIT
jgi:hypothetical protein